MSQRSKAFVGLMSFLVATTSLAGEAIAPSNVDSFAIGEYSTAVYDYYDALSEPDFLSEIK